MRGDYWGAETAGAFDALCKIAMSGPGRRIAVAVPSLRSVFDARWLIRRDAPDGSEIFGTPSAVVFPNGSIAYLYSSCETQRARGANCHALVVVDGGLNPCMEELIDVLRMGLRLGDCEEIAVEINLPQYGHFGAKGATDES